VIDCGVHIFRLLHQIRNHKDAALFQARLGTPVP
jgi:hypothetical protein